MHNVRGVLKEYQYRSNKQPTVLSTSFGRLNALSYRRSLRTCRCLHHRSYSICLLYVCVIAQVLGCGIQSFGDTFPRPQKWGMGRRMIRGFGEEREAGQQSASIVVVEQLLLFITTEREHCQQQQSESIVVSCRAQLLSGAAKLRTSDTAVFKVRGRGGGGGGGGGGGRFIQS